MEFKREIHLNDENITAYTLSSITDVRVKRFTNSEETQSKINILKTKTIAIGVPSNWSANWSGNVQDYGGYIFPRGAFIGDTQIYPPIITSYIDKVSGFDDHTAGFFRLANHTSNAEIGFENTNDNSNIVWPGVFKVTYSTTNPSILMSNLTNPNYFTTVSIPSFDTTIQNNNQWAYMRGNSIFIKDPLLTKQIPYKDIIQWGSSFPSSYYSYFRVDLDPSYTTNANRILEKKVSEGVPYLYNNLDNDVEITRRTCILAGMGENATQMIDSNMAITSDMITINSGTTSYNILKYYYKGQLLTDLTASLAYIMPKWSRQITNINESPTHYSYTTSSSSSVGTGWLNTRYIGYGGVWPTYVTPYSVDSPTNSYFYWKQYANQALTGTGPFGQYNYINFIKLFNVFLIKVTGNEDMFSFGQSSLYYNRLTYGFNSDSPVGSITMNSSSYDGFNNYIIGINENNTPIHIYNSVPNSLIRNSEVMAIKHVMQPIGITNPQIERICPAVSIKHRFSTYLQEGIASPFKVMAYSYAKTFSDVSNITYSINNANNTTNITIHMNNHPNSNYWYNISASTPNTYTYCYIAADYLTNLGERTLTIGRVISDTYLCIKKETVTINNTQTQTIYRSYYTSLMNSSGVIDD